MSQDFHCPYRQSSLLQQALTPDKVRIAFLLGAGCPVSIDVSNGSASEPLIPDMANLTKHIEATLTGSTSANKGHFEAIVARLRAGGKGSPTIEDILSYVRSMGEVIFDSTIDGLNKVGLSSLDREICKITTDVVDVVLPTETTPYHQLATWIRGIPRANPVEIFTPNYDLLIEQALETNHIPYFDGFVGSRRAFFDLPSMESDTIPTRWARLWKIHGSLNWWRHKVGNNEYEILRGEKAGSDDHQMIYPSHLKYDESRRLPYLAMLDRLRGFLARGQAVLVVSGYSFGDQHLNEVVIDGLRSNPNAMCFGLLHGNRSNYPYALAQAKKQPNLSLFASDGAVVGSLERDWRPDEQLGHPMHGLSVDKEKTTSPGSTPSKCKFLLGDFKVFGQFLAEQLSTSKDDESNS